MYINGGVQLWLFTMLLLYTLTHQCERIYIDNRYCYSILCSDGEEPMPCNKFDERSATCKPCPSDTFSNGHTRLGERCSIKTFCVDDHMTVEDEGSPMRDRVCGCEKGYRMSYYVHKCYRVPKTTTPSPPSTTHEAIKSTQQYKEGAAEDPLPVSSHSNSHSLSLLCGYIFVYVLLKFRDA